MATPEAITPDSHDDSSGNTGLRNEILRPDPNHNFYLSAEAMQEGYLSFTADLVDKLAGDEDTPGYDTVIYLDKSARPVEWMVGKMWPLVAPQRNNPETGKLETVPKPDTKFLNIDRMPYRNDPKLSFDEAGMKPITQADIDGLRNIFQIGEQNLLDGKRVLIVDEQADTGDTLTVAHKLLQTAFPDSEFDKFAWITHTKVSKDGKAPEPEIKNRPAWYPLENYPNDEKGEVDQTGRGVFNPVPYDSADKPHGRPDRFSPESYKFLSTLPKLKVAFDSLPLRQKSEYAELMTQAAQTDDLEIARSFKQQAENMLYIKDPKSDQLRKEIGQMVTDFANGKLSPRIATGRKEILGQPAEKYGRQATKIREDRKRRDSRP